MERPAGITKADIRQWDYRLQYESEVPKWWTWPGNPFIEISYAIYWLEPRLNAIGPNSCSKYVVSKITQTVLTNFAKECVAHFNPDVWAMAEETLEKWRLGTLQPFRHDLFPMMIVRINCLRLFVGYIGYRVRGIFFQ